MAEQELKDLRQKFQKQQQQFQNYRDECKALENFLEEQSNKKEKEIRKLKEQAITKQKNYKLMKTENNHLLSEIATLKAQLQEKGNKKDAVMMQQHLKSQLQGKTSQLQVSLQKIAQNEQKIASLTFELTQLASKNEQKEQLVIKYENRISQLNEIIQRQKVQNEQLFNQNQKLVKSQSLTKRIIKEQVTVKKTKERDESAHLEYQLQQTKAKHQQKLSRYEDKIAKMDRTIKQLKHRLQESQQSQLSALSKQQSIQRNSDMAFKMYIGCLIMTKPHYLSPFLDVNEQSRTLKLFKPARNGCFEKALGSTKHRFSMLTYNKSQIVQSIVNKITNQEIDSHHLVLIYGTKKSAKKNLFVEIIAQLLSYLSQKLKDYQESDCSAVYIRRSYDEPCQKEQAYSINQITELLQKMTSASGSQPKRNQRLSSNRKTQKPRVAYFSLSIGQFMIQIATSSFTNISLKQKDDASTFYNNILYSKLPDILQSAHSQKYLVFTLNPIVDLYDDCKNILSVTACKSLFMSPTKQEKQIDNPNKQLLNTVVRRKLQSYEREIEQGQLRIKRVEEQCGYYRLKFNELQERLKNLISTHHSQSAYLKKSPILLSYQKMLKFVHSVQAKSSQCMESIDSVINLEEIDFNENQQHQECL